MDDMSYASGDNPSAKRPTTAAQLAQAHFYRPGSALAVVAMLTPPLIALAMGGVAVLTPRSIPVILPVLFVLCCAWLPLTWVALVRVRTTPAGIACARPWRPWVDLRWESIEQAQQSGPRIILTTSDGRRALFAPILLQDGARLRRELLVRLAPQILDERLRAAARSLLEEQVTPKQDGGLAGRLSARPLAFARVAAAIFVGVAVAAVAGAIASWPFARDALALSLAIAAGIGTLAVGIGIAAVLWLGQRLEVSDAGVHVVHAWPRRSQTIAWSQILLVEHTPGERIIRLRGDGRLICAGPGLLRETDRAIMRAFLNAYCVEQGIPVVQRVWLF